MRAFDVLYLNEKRLKKETAMDMNPSEALQSNRTQAVEFGGGDWTKELQTRASGIDFMMLFATDPRLYQRAGYTSQTNILRWAAIHEHEPLRITEESVDELMIKEMGEKAWPLGKVDLLGYLF